MTKQTEFTFSVPSGCLPGLKKCHFSLITAPEEGSFQCALFLIVDGVYELFKNGLNFPMQAQTQLSVNVHNSQGPSSPPAPGGAGELSLISDSQYRTTNIFSDIQQNHCPSHLNLWLKTTLGCCQNTDMFQVSWLLQRPRSGTTGHCSKQRQTRNSSSVKPQIALPSEQECCLPTVITLVKKQHTERKCRLNIPLVFTNLTGLILEF